MKSRTAQPLIRPVYIVAIALCLINEPLDAQTSSTWVGASGDKFSENDSWDAGVPSQNDTAIFDSNSNYDVNIDVTAAVDKIEIKDGTVALLGGNAISANLVEANSSDFLVTEPGTLITTTDISIGMNGPTQFGTKNSGAIEVTNDTNIFAGSSLVVDDAQFSSNLLFLNGLLEIENSGVVDGIGVSNGTAIAAGSGTAGDAIVSGSGSTWNTGFLLVGRDGDGTLTIENGGLVTSSNIYIGFNSTGEGDVTVDGGNSRISAAGNLTVGNNGTGTLNVINGGSVTAVNGLIRNSSTVEIGTLNGTGSAGTVELNGDLTIGNLNAEGTLNVNNNGFVEIDGETTIETGSLVRLYEFVEFLQNSLIVRGQILVQGEEACIGGDVSIESNGRIDVFLNTVLNLSDNLEHNGDEIFNAGRINVNGDWIGNGPFTGPGIVNFKGTLRPGFGIGSAQFGGDVELATASVVVDVNGTSPGIQYDQMLIDGDLDIQSTDLNLSLLGGFLPMDGDEFKIIEVGGALTGTFNGLPEGAILLNNGSLQLSISYTGGDGNDVVVVAAVNNVLLGDLNLDGVVNLLDVAPFVNRLTTGTFQAEADINMDGDVNLLDISPFVAIISD